MGTTDSKPYEGRHRFKVRIEKARADILCVIRDVTAEKHGYDYKPRHSACFRPATLPVEPCRIHGEVDR